ncbi:MAG: hypothetical protein ABIN35_00695 [candidate division WOR-3 bacterium]
MIFQWVQTLPSVFDVNIDIPRPSIDLDHDGNIYVAYVNATPASSGQTQTGSIDISIVKVDPNGQIVWVRQHPSFNTSQSDAEPDLCVDSLGNIYVAYRTSGSISGQTETVTSLDIVVFKMDTNGNTLWVKQSSEFSTTDHDYSPSIAVDGSGNVFVAYWTVDDNMPVEYYDRVILFKLDTNGQFLWIKNQHDINTPGGNYNPAIAVDHEDCCYLTYWCDGQSITGETASGNTDIIIIRTDPNGNVLWVRQRPSFNTNDQDDSPSITVDQNNNCYVAYSTYGATLSNQSSGNFDIAITKLDSNGNVFWTIQKPTFNSNSADIAPAIKAIPPGFLYLSYSTYGLISGQTKTGQPDIVITQLDYDGNFIDLLQQPDFNTPVENVFPDISVDLNGNCYVVFYSINPEDGVETQELKIVKVSSLICVVGQTQILMGDGHQKRICDIQRGEIVAPCHRVSRVCREPIDLQSTVDLMIFEPKCLGNYPSERLVITPNHPIFYQNARRPAMCFKHCSGVKMLHKIPIKLLTEIFIDNDFALYDLQFDHEGSYIANGVEIQSRSPYSFFSPLPKDLYYDQSLYTQEQVWDQMDHLIPFDSSMLNFNLLVLKNHHHHYHHHHHCTKREKPKVNTIMKYQ